MEYVNGFMGVDFFAGFKSLSLVKDYQMRNQGVFPELENQTFVFGCINC